MSKSTKMVPTTELLEHVLSTPDDNLRSYFDLTDRVLDHMNLNNNDYESIRYLIRHSIQYGIVVGYELSSSEVTNSSQYDKFLDKKYKEYYEEAI